MPTFECIDCSSRRETDSLDCSCSRCGGAMLLASDDRHRVDRRSFGKAPPGVWRYRGLLPDVPDRSIVTLGEGGTPLLPAKRLGEELGLDDLVVKDETLNPTGSFIDRGSTVLVSLAKERGVRRFSCSTTGNLGASLAAYAAKAGVETEISINPNIDRGKLYQMIAYGAKVDVYSGHPAGPGKGQEAQDVSPKNPFLLEGEKTTGLEILDDLGWAQPDAVVLPVGTGGHLTMVWRSLLEMTRAGLIDEPRSRLIGVQLRPSPSYEARRRTGRSQTTLTELEVKEESEPIFSSAAAKSIRASGGRGVEVTMKEVLAGMSLLAKTEGIFAEPGAASVVAALRRAKDDGVLGRHDKVVCVVTGSGLKDTKAMARVAKAQRRLLHQEEFMIRPMELGTTKLELMKSLSKRPSFGYELWKALSAEKRMTTASVYQHLTELEAAALVRRAGVARFRGRERVFYELTRKGDEILRVLKPG